MHSLSQLLTCFFFNFLLLFFFSGLGRMLFCAVYGEWKSREWFSFQHLLAGTLVATAVYAAIQTGGKTILLPVLLLTTGFVFFSGKTLAATLSAKQNLQILLPAVVVYFFYYLQAFVSFDAALYRYPDGDYLFYSRLVQYVNLNHPENLRLEFLYPERFGVETYHWGDIWLGALVNRLGAGYHYVLLLVVSPLLSALFALGLYGYLLLLFPRATQRVWVAILAIAAPLLSGFAFSYPLFLYEPYIFTQSFAYYPKLLFPGCMLVAMLIELRQQNWNAVFLLLVLAVFVFVNVLPAFALTGTVLFVAGLAAGWFRIRAIVPALVLCLVSLGYFVFFYYQPSYEGTGLVTAQNEQLSLVERGRLILFSAAKGSLQFLRFVPYLLLLALAVPWKKIRVRSIFQAIPREVYVLLLLLLSGLLAYGIVAPISMDAMQCFQNPYMPATSILVAIALLYCLQSERFRKVKGYLAVGIIGLNLAYNYAFDYQVNTVAKTDFEKVKSFAQQGGNGLMVNLRSFKNYQSKYAAHTVLNQPLGYLDYIYPVYVNASLNIPYARFADVEPYQQNEVETVRDWGPYAYYVKAKGGALPPEQQVQQFIRENNIRSVTVAPDTLLPPYLAAGVRDSLELYSRWKLYHLD